jgi:hypothetical protein
LIDLSYRGTRTGLRDVTKPIVREVVSHRKSEVSRRSASDDITLSTTQYRREVKYSQTCRPKFSSLQTEIFERYLDICFAKGALPREGTPKEKEIRLKSLHGVADKATAGILDMAQQGWGGNKAMSGTVLKGLGWGPKHRVKVWARDFENELLR